MSQKNKKRGKNKKSRDEKQKRDILFAEENQMYSQVEKMLGNCRLMAKAIGKGSDGKTRLCHIRGKLRKRVWIREGSMILIGLRDFEDDKADVIHCYFPEEVQRLVAYEEIPEVQDGGKVEDYQVQWEIEEIPEPSGKEINVEQEIDDLQDNYFQT